MVKKMKKEYKLLIRIFLVEFIGVLIMSELGISVHSWTGNAIGVLLLLGPILILLHLLSKDNNISENYRSLSKMAFWYLLICYLAGTVGKAYALGLIVL